MGDRATLPPSQVQHSVTARWKFYRRILASKPSTRVPSMQDASLHSWDPVSSMRDMSSTFSPHRMQQRGWYALGCGEGRSRDPARRAVFLHVGTDGSPSRASTASGSIDSALVAACPSQWKWIGSTVGVHRVPRYGDSRGWVAPGVGEVRSNCGGGICTWSVPWSWENDVAPIGLQMLSEGSR